MVKEEEHICCICGKTFSGYGNNPWPLKEKGRCCDECNKKVIEQRIQYHEIKKIVDSW